MINDIVRCSECENPEFFSINKFIIEKEGSIYKKTSIKQVIVCAKCLKEIDLEKEK